MKAGALKYFFERTRKSGDNVMSHTHDGYEIVYYKSGKGKTVIRDDVYEYTPDTYALILPSSPHDEHADEDTSLICAVFNGDGVYNDGVNGEGATQSALPAGVYRDDNGTVLACLTLIGAEQKRNDRLSPEITAHALRIILLETERKSPALPDSRLTPDPMFETALTYIRDYYNTDIDIKELASMTRYSYDRFRHLFRERYGMPPGRFLMLTRLEGAKQMLRDVNMPSVGIKTVALSNGFSSYTHFCSVFCKEQGQTPSEYRNSVKVDEKTK